MIDFVCDDVLHWARNYTGPKFHAALLDGPYHLNFMGKKWDASGPNAICFQPETWAALAEHLHDGAFIMAFSGARTYHRMACAIEDAGFVLHSMIASCFGSGFPKATRIKDSEIFSGHRYGLQAIKPAMEPICIAQKPYSKKPIDCIVATGAGALNIDKSRISNSDNLARMNKGGDNGWKNSSGGPNEAARRQMEGLPQLGRWPANFIMQHSPNCNGVCAEDCPVAELSRQSGESTSGGRTGFVKTNQWTEAGRNGTGYITESSRTGDTGTAARFFHQSDFSLEQQEAIDSAAPFFYFAKASRGERDKGLDGVERKVDDHNLSSNACARCGRRVKANGSGAKCECGDLRETVKLETTTRNPHPTVKSLKLTRYLATLLLPPAAYAPRRLLNPFCGSGSEAIGAYMAGFEEIVAIEREQEYVDIAQKRADYWQAQTAQPMLFGGTG